MSTLGGFNTEYLSRGLKYWLCGARYILCTTCAICRPPLIAYPLTLFRSGGLAARLMDPSNPEPKWTLEGPWTYLSGAVYVVGSLSLVRSPCRDAVMVHVLCGIGGRWGDMCMVLKRVPYGGDCGWNGLAFDAVFSTLTFCCSIFKGPCGIPHVYRTLVTFPFLTSLPPQSSRNRLRERRQRKKRESELPFLTCHHLPLATSRFDGIVVRVEHLTSPPRWHVHQGAITWDLK
jgi:hypothetical protein